VGLPPDHTNSWTTVEGLYAELVKTGLARPLKSSEVPEDGDMVFFHWDLKGAKPLDHAGMIVQGNNHNLNTEWYTSHTSNRLTTMAREYENIGVYLHEHEPAISVAEGSIRGKKWQWYILRPVRTDAYVVP
jgi:hypothetical protein